MGGMISTMSVGYLGPKLGHRLSEALGARDKDPPSIVLVPPYFERDLRARARFAQSSYDTLPSRLALQRLMHDYLQPEITGALHLSPPADPRVSVAARVGMQGGDMTLRWQPLGAQHTHTFVDITANPKNAGDVSVRGSFFDPESGVGVFTSLPMAKQLSRDVGQVGIRYSTPAASAGFILSPSDGRMRNLWLVARNAGWITGLQIRPGTSLPGMSTLLGPPSEVPATLPWGAAARVPKTSDSFGGWLQDHTSLCLLYTPPTFGSASGQGAFTAGLEVVDGRTLAVTFFQHLAVSRKVVNPFEKSDVVGITSYIDVGLQLDMPLRSALDGTTGFASTSSIVDSRYSSPVAMTAASAVPATSVAGASGVALPSDTKVSYSSSSAPTQPATSAAPPAVAAAQSAIAAANGGGGSGGGGGVAAADTAGVSIAASWQLNKNWLLKGRVGTDSAAVAVGLRGWFQPSLAITACAHYNYGVGALRYGATISLENHGALIYERGTAEPSGRTMLQRHIAGPDDMANFTGEGPLVLRSDTAAQAAAPSPRSSTEAYL